MVEKTVRHGLLLDFYGGLLTDKQRQVLGAYFEDDLSLGEIAEEMQVSRAAVHDLVKRSLASLEDLETGLGLVARHDRMRHRLAQVRTAVGEASERARQLGVPELASVIERLGCEFTAILEDDETSSLLGG